MSIDLLSCLINNYFEIIKTGPLLNEINESKIAIVCHCRQNVKTNLGKIHPKLYYINKNTNSHIPFNNIIKEIGVGIKYIDPSCPDDKWENIKDKTLMYIWGIFCPIYVSHIIQNNTSKILNEILKNSYQKLVIGGKVLFPSILKGYIRNNNLFEYLKQKIESSDENFAGFAFEIVSIDKFPYIISKEGYIEIEEYYVFTKIF